jgi:short-subunit dehydrogenase
MVDKNSGKCLITGASSGIGAAFARKLAARGYAVVLVARRVERLESLANELRNQYHVQAEVLVADLADSADIQRVADYAAGLDDLEILVNNAGFAVWGNYAETPVERQLEMVQVHVNASMCLCRAALPKMIASRRGNIINVSSVAAFTPKPRDVIYTASKAFLNVFSESLQMELRGCGVKVQALCPGFTRTEFHDNPQYESLKLKQSLPGILWMYPDKVVDISLRALRSNRVIVIPGFLNQVIVVLGRSGIAGMLMNALRDFIMK